MGQAVTNIKSELIKQQCWRYQFTIKVRLHQFISVNDEGDEFRITSAVAHN